MGRLNEDAGSIWAGASAAATRTEATNPEPSAFFSLMLRDELTRIEAESFTAQAA